jgi:hypothetical protein
MVYETVYRDELMPESQMNTLSVHPEHVNILKHSSVMSRIIGGLTNYAYHIPERNNVCTHVHSHKDLESHFFIQNHEACLIYIYILSACELLIARRNS